MKFFFFNQKKKRKRKSTNIVNIGNRVLIQITHLFACLLVMALICLEQHENLILETLLASFLISSIHRSIYGLELGQWWINCKLKVAFYNYNVYPIWREAVMISRIARVSDMRRVVLNQFSFYFVNFFLTIFVYKLGRGIAIHLIMKHLYSIYISLGKVETTRIESMSDTMHINSNTSIITLNKIVINFIIKLLSL